MDYRAERDYSENFNFPQPGCSMIAISACWGSMYNTMACDSASSGFLVVLDSSTGNLISDIPLGEGWPAGQHSLQMDPV